ncbi:hypothetical protein ABZX90_11110 [Streptomyces sp. NPDC002935]|uniref:hypothetical protein n=1 Tax=Streptomyces sp. NPDC002935 TaxID=3154545 RepID=UPI0033BAFF27
MARRTSAVRQERNTLHLQRFLQVACATWAIKDAFRSLTQNLNTFKTEFTETEPHGSSRPYRNEVVLVAVMSGDVSRGLSGGRRAVLVVLHVLRGMARKPTAQKRRGA